MGWVAAGGELGSAGGQPSNHNLSLDEPQRMKGTCPRERDWEGLGIIEDPALLTSVGELLSKPTQPRCRQALHLGRPRVAPGREGWGCQMFSWKVEAGCGGCLQTSPHSPAQSSTLVCISPPPPGSSKLSQTPDTAVLTEDSKPRVARKYKQADRMLVMYAHATGVAFEEDNGIKEKAWTYSLLSGSKIHSGAE